MKLLDIYSYLISNWLNGGAFTHRGRMESTSIVPMYNSILTKTTAKQVYRIVGIKPVGVDIDFVSYLRDRMFELNPNVFLDITFFEHPVVMNVNQERFQRSFHRSADMYSSYKEAFDSQSGLARLTGKTYRLPGGQRLKLSRDRLDDLYQVFVSHKELYDNLSAGGTVCIVNIFIEIAGETLQEVKRAGQDLYGLLGALNIGVDLVKSANRAYLEQFGAATPAPKTLNKKFLPQLLFTEQNRAAWSPYKARGLVGDTKNAILFGCDFRSRLPFSVNLFSSGAAEVFMVLGKTGSGKTYACFQIALSALALGCSVTALDLKGREWSAISGLTNTKIVTFDERHPSFVNTLRLDDMNATYENAHELFNTAIKGTVQLFMLIINLQPGEGNVNDIELVVREAVMKMYANRHIDPSNPATFADTRNMQYQDVLPILEGLKSTATYTPEQKHMVAVARSRLNAFIGDSGIFSEAFKNEISLGDVLHAPFVIYELNKNQTGNSSDNLDIIRIFMIQFLDSKKKTMLKESGKFLFCFYEELQRSQSFPLLLNYICADVTGSRSSNCCIFLLLNSLKVLQSKEGQDIRSNLTSFVTGFCEDNDINFIEEEMGKPWLASQLRLFRDKQQIYRNCFAAAIDNGRSVFESVYRAELPADLSRRFRTRTIIEEE